MRRILFSPSWWGRHALMIAAVAACALLGRWQWDKALGPNGAGYNFAYGVQWWIFASIVVYGWHRIIRDELRPPAARTPAGSAEAEIYFEQAPTGEFPGGPVRVPRQAVVEPVDEELAAYNDYLAWLNAHPRR